MRKPSPFFLCLFVPFCGLFLWSGLLLMCLSLPGQAQQGAPPALQRDLLPDAEITSDSWSVTGQDGSAEVEQVACTVKNCPHALKITVLKATPDVFWNVQLSQGVSAAVPKGAALRLHFWGRSKTHNPIVALLEHTAPPYEKLFLQSLTLTEEWKEYTFPFRPEQEIPAKWSGLRFQLAKQAGEIELTDISLENTDAPRLPPNALLTKTSVLSGDTLHAFQLVGGKAGDATLVTVPVTGQPFTQGLRVTIKQRPPNPWDIQLNSRTTTPVTKGDVLLATYYVRAVSPQDGSASAAFVFERASEPYDKSSDAAIQPGSNWQKVNVRFVAGDSFAPGAVQINFRVGTGVQTLEFGGIEVVNYGRTRKLKDLPVTGGTYRGREPDAPWRKAAAERIEKYRKGDLTVVVTDAQGKPVSGAKVEVRMTRHAFGFGTAVPAGLLIGETSTAKKVREHLLENFNKIVLESDLKWPSWEANRELGIQGVQWAHDHNIPVRGHNLVWPSWHNSPSHLKTEYDQHKATDVGAKWLDETVTAHITDELTALKGKCVEWDVINEPYDNHDFMDILGPDTMGKWFRLAHRLDPDALLFLNDYNTFGEDGSTAHANAFYEILRLLKEKGAPLGGIGIQSHFGSLLPAPDQMLQTLDRFAGLGVPLEITEFDLKNDDPDLQADFTRDFLTLAFSHPAVNGFLMWGFWDGSHWLNNAPLYNRDWTLKPSGKVWQNLLFHQWWTQAQGVTNRAGQFTVRGFLGDYEITVTGVDGTKHTLPAQLGIKGVQVHGQL